MLAEGCVHILASDAHNLGRRPPDLIEGRRAAERLIGDEEAHHLVVTRPGGALANTAPGDLPLPEGSAKSKEAGGRDGKVRTFDSSAGGG